MIVAIISAMIILEEMIIALTIVKGFGLLGFGFQAGLRLLWGLGGKLRILHPYGLNFKLCQSDIELQ